MGFTQIVVLLRLITDWINQYLSKIKLKKEQAERDVSETDPNAWFDDQFNASGGVQQYVPATNQADTGKNTG